MVKSALKSPDSCWSVPSAHLIPSDAQKWISTPWLLKSFYQNLVVNCKTNWSDKSCKQKICCKNHWVVSLIGGSPEQTVKWAIFVKVSTITKRPFFPLLNVIKSNDTVAQRYIGMGDGTKSPHYLSSVSFVLWQAEQEVASSWFMMIKNPIIKLSWRVQVAWSKYALTTKT